jgi:ClpP class serine protease
LIFSSGSSVVGSIGVIAASFGLHEAIGKLGVERRVLTAGWKSHQTFIDAAAK